MALFKTVAIGGTFDHLHKGHRLLIQSAMSLGERIVVGLTTDEMIQDKSFFQQIQDFSVRERHLRKLLRHQDSVVPLHDHYGPTILQEIFDAIVVTQHTYPITNVINQLRAQRSLAPLHVHVAPFELDHKGEIISSTRIRKGEIDQEGLIFTESFSQTIIFSEDDKDRIRAFGQQFGHVIERIPDHQFGSRILIGDVTTKRFLAEKYPFSFAFVDGKTQRLSFPLLPYSYASILHNPAGTIQPEVCGIFMRSATTGSRLIFVEGEEDLFAVPAVLLSPIGTEVYFGDPIEDNLIRILVTAEIKSELCKILQIAKLNQDGVQYLP